LWLEKPGGEGEHAYENGEAWARSTGVLSSGRDGPCFAASSVAFLFFPDDGVSLQGSLFTVTPDACACAAFAACSFFATLFSSLVSTGSTVEPLDSSPHSTRHGHGVGDLRKKKASFHPLIQGGIPLKSAPVTSLPRKQYHTL